MHFLKENFNPEWNFNGDAAGNVNSITINKSAVEIIDVGMYVFRFDFVTNHSFFVRIVLALKVLVNKFLYLLS